jgi:predicted short-subunit dehydrogenase-like oxidoreductase (DUF2520 family)
MFKLLPLLRQYRPKIVISCKNSILTIRKIERVSIVGTGKVAEHFLIAIKQCGIEIVQLVGRDPVKTNTLAKSANTIGVVGFDGLATGSDLVLIAVSDAAISEVARLLPDDGALVAHTSGMAGLDVLGPKRKNCGVFYPLQTFTEGRDLHYDEIPFFVEAGNKQDEDALFELAGRISRNVYRANSEQRKIMHLAAVFACNFTNQLYVMASEILNEANLGFDVLGPLIRETAAKATELGPEKAQTGPALRNDMETIKQHLKLLEDKSEFREIYQLLSNRITNTHNT